MTDIFRYRVFAFVFITVGAVTILVLSWLIWASWKSVHVVREAELRAIEFEQLSGKITYLDEVLTSAARLAASTGDAQWEARYDEHVPLLDKAIARAIAIAGETPASSGVRQTNDANNALIAMEEEAFALARDGRRTEALALLQSDVYERQKALYSRGMNSFVDALQSKIFETDAEKIRDVNLSLVAAFSALVVLMALWCFFVRLLYRQQQQLSALNRELEFANSAKSEFLTTMSHEIRTPMNGVLGMASVLMATDLTAEQRKQVLTIKHSGETLLLLLNDILDLSKIEAGRVELETLNFRLSNLLNSTAAFWESQFRSKNLDFEIAVDPDVAPVLKSDPTRIRQVLFNLIGNAFKFTKEGGVKVTVSQRLVDNQPVLTFAIVDTGVGIAPEAQAKLFQKFSQADSSVTRKYGGTGLGLAICKQLVELMGGEIGVRSAPPQGATFWFTIACEHGSVDAAEADEWMTDHDEPPASNSPLRILVAEDNNVNQMVIGAILKKAGHNVDIVGNGIEAVAAVMRSQYDLILMDVQMPEMDGATATRKIRKISGYPQRVPIVAVTANAMLGDREKYLDAGMSDYLSKPITAHRLLGLLAKYAASAEAIEAPDAVWAVEISKKSSTAGRRH